MFVFYALAILVPIDAYSTQISISFDGTVLKDIYVWYFFNICMLKTKFLIMAHSTTYIRDKL